MASGSGASGLASAIGQKSRLRPEDIWANRRAAFLLLLLSFLYLCLFRHFTSMEPDEGILLQGAQRILAGQIPYRDFFSFYTPGSYYELAFVFRLFGSSVAVARTLLRSRCCLNSPREPDSVLALSWDFLRFIGCSGTDRG